jgi:DNA-binding NarL/FixJ family response regulator
MRKVPSTRTGKQRRSSRSTKSQIAVIDSKKLRQAGIVHLLGAWADAKGLVLKSVSANKPLEESGIGPNCQMIIVNVGNSSIADEPEQTWIRNLSSLAPDAPIVILSDREEPREVCAAFEAGAAGFVPTSTDPAVAVNALSFIESGGSFFPPSALLSRFSHDGPRLEIGDSSATSRLVGERSSHLSRQLSGKQEQVLEHLCKGLSNKAIARRMNTSEATIKVHVRRLLHKLGAKNRTQAALSALATAIQRSSDGVSVGFGLLFVNGLNCVPTL